VLVGWLINTSEGLNEKRGEGAMKRVLYVGDCSMRVELEVKGAEVVSSMDRWVNMSKFLLGALGGEEFSVTHMPPHIAFGEFPRTAGDMGKYDAVILSDCGYDTLALYPGQEKFTRQTNRILEIVEYVRSGGALLYCGGYFGFQGRFGHARWYGTPLASILPVAVLPIPDDRVEAMQGVKPKILVTDHPVTRDIPWDTCPYFLGYNRTGKRDDAQLLGTIDGEPFLAIREEGAGRIVAFTSDPAPHWGVEFVKWDYYRQFWLQVMRWLTRSR